MTTTTERGQVDEQAWVDAAARIAPLPASTMKLATMLAAADVDVREVVEIVTYDPALTAALLRSANSVASGARQPVTTVRDAVMRVGFGNVVSVAMRLALATTFDLALPLYSLGQGDVYRHAVRAAVAAEAVRARSQGKVPPAAMTAALLHDAGKLLLDGVYGGRMVSLVGALAERDGSALVETEADVFGTDHAEVAGFLARHWRLPLTLVDGMVNHHRPLEGERTARAVYLADAVAHDLDGGEPPAPPSELTVVVLGSLGMGVDDWSPIVLDARHRARLVAAAQTG